MKCSSFLTSTLIVQLNVSPFLLRLRPMRILLSVILLVMALMLSSCGGSESDTTNTTDTSFQVVVFSDVHFNPFYDPSSSLFDALVGAEASEWEDIFKTSTIPAPSVWGNDSNYPLLVRALSNIRRNLGASPLIIFTGDILSHRFSQTFYARYGSPNPPGPADVTAMQTFANKTVAFFLEQVRASVGNIPVMFVVGNNDSYADAGPDSTFLSDTAEFFYTSFLKGTVDHQTFLTTFKSGGYYSAEPPGTHLMVIGLNTTMFPASPALGDTSAAVDLELTWLEATLDSAKARGKKVWLLMHIPPGANILATAQAFDNGGPLTPAMATMMWKQDYQTRFLHVLANYRGIITLKLAGHTHMDEYRIMLPDDVLALTPSISPGSGNDPAFKIFTFDYNSLKATDYTSFNYDIASMPPQFNRYYTFSAAYSAPGLLENSLAQLYPVLATDNEKQSLYRGAYFSGRAYSVPTFNPITTTNWPVFMCGIRYMDQQGFIDCVNSY